MSSTSEKESKDALKGTALDIYRLMLTSNKPLGVREIQRTLDLSSPSVAQHHLSMLERAGLIKRESGNYVINKVLLQNCVKISRFLIPRYFFYTVFALMVIVLELTVLEPNVIYQAYVFSVIASIIVVAIFCYETVRVWRSGSL
ncbi:MAG: ArsR family transcriptional regulator [Chloroflexi bacterium]|nr:ArsR family transcriptional regulator [Chloroflexota bacterium]